MPAPVTPNTPKAKPVATAVIKYAPTFEEKLRVIDRAGYGVILTRTREPLRVIEALKSYTFTRKNPTTNELDSLFRVWDCVRGWVEYPVKATYAEGSLELTEENPTVCDPGVDIKDALGLIQDVSNLGVKPWPTGIFVFNYPHFQIPGNAEFIVTLKRYCHTLPTGRSRVVLIVPEGFMMPSELDDDITILDFTVPIQRELNLRFDALLGELGKENPFDEHEVSAITAAGLGMTELDFDQSVSLAIAETSGVSSDKPITATLDEFLTIIYRCKMEAVKRTNILSLVDTIPVEDIAGMENLKAWCQERHNWLTPAAKDFGLRAPRGMLIVGVQGTGKSLAPKGIASIFKLPCVKFDMAKVFDKYVGQSEQRMDMALAFIQAIAPCVVWVDEIDKSGSKDGSSDASERVKQKLLTFMQEAPDGIFWVPTANRTDNIPPELIRPGRINLTMGVVLPKPSEREHAFKIHLRKRKQSPALTDLALAVTASDGYTPAEIEEAVNNATGECFTRGAKMSGALLAKHVKFIKPQSISHKADMDRIIEWCNKNAIPASAEQAKAEDRTIPAEAKKGPRRIGG